MKTLFNLLKLIPAFQKLLNEFFESERKQYEQDLVDYKKFADDAIAAVRMHRERADAAEAEAEKLRAHIGTLEQVIRDRKAEIEELRNATTKKLQAVDDMDSESVFNATLFQPRSTPRS